MFFRRYISCLTVVSVFLVTGAISLNVLVDPYAIFGTPRNPVFNELKPFAGDRGRIAKVYQVERLEPRTVILGNSRPELGLDPEHSCIKGGPNPAYNLGLPGLSFVRQLQYGLHAIETGRVGRVLLGVDFLDFLFVSGRSIDQESLGNPPAYLRTPFRPESLRYELQKAKNYSTAASSLDALGASVVTVLVQSRSDIATRTAFGFHPAEGLYRPIIEREGVGSLFAQKNEELAARLQGKEWRLIDEYTNDSTDFIALRRFLEFTSERDIEVIIFINPYHADYLSHLRLAGLWELFDEWKRRLAWTAEEAAVPAWDFSGVTTYTTEQLPPVEYRRRALRWFWEPAHYREELGALMLHRMLRCDGVGDSAIEEFGVEMRRAEIAGYLEEQQRLFSEYVDNYHAAWSRVSSFYAD